LHPELYIKFEVDEGKKDEIGKETIREKAKEFVST
jgi:hypothetical protein